MYTQKLFYVTIGHFNAINVKHELDFYRMFFAVCVCRCKCGPVTREKKYTNRVGG